MRRTPLVSPLLTLGLLLAALGAHAQEAPEGEDPPVDEEEVVADEEEVVADEEEIVADEEGADEEGADEEEVVAEEEVVSETAADAGAESEEAIPEGIFAPGQEPWRAAPAGQGVTWGRLIDKESGEPALEAQIKVKSTGAIVLTDFEGYYRLELPPGKYELEVFYEMYEPETLSGVVIQAGRVSRHDVELTPQEGAIEEIVIEDQAESQTIEGLALKRQRAVASGDAIGREEISKGTDSNAAEAAQRVTGATIFDGRFVYVRGLGERYSNSLLSGYPLPSPEPDRAAVPLDVFPAATLDSLTIVKSFTPDMPADFAGGSVQIETRSVPKEPLFQVTLNAGVNTQSTFQDRLDYASSGTDWLGFDDGTRAMPSNVPQDQETVDNGSVPNFPDGTPNPLTPEDLIDIGRSVNSRMRPFITGTPPNHGGSIVGGMTWNVGKNKKQQLGVLASLNYSRQYEVYHDVVVKEYTLTDEDPRGFQERVDYRLDAGEEQIRWGAFGKLSYLPAAGHKLSLTGLRSQIADDWAHEYQGRNISAATSFTATQLGWVDRGMTFGMLEGDHEFPALQRASLGWNLSIASANRNEPDRRDTVYQNVQGLPIDDADLLGERAPGWAYFQGDESGRHFWSEQAENSGGGKLDWTQPLLKADPAKERLDLKVGGLINLKNRSFSARRLILLPTGPTTRDDTYYCIGEEYDRDCSGKLFNDDNIPSLLQLVENPQSGDFYAATLNVYAGYAMVDWEPSRLIRLAGGARVEGTDQSVTPLDPLNTQVVGDGGAFSAVSFLPALSVIFSGTEKSKTRISYGRTLARPQVREIAPFAFSDYFGGRVVTGNPDLEITTIDNFDVRFEFWPTLTEIVAFSAFYKRLTKPIEQILIPADSSPQLTYINSDAANVAGFELEARKQLGFLTKTLKDFYLGGNFTLAYSRVEVPQTGFITITSLSRTLINQAPWVINGVLGYQNEKIGTTVQLAYNVRAATLVEVGTNTIPDAYEQSFHSLDLAYGQKFLEHWSAKFSIENIVNDDVLVTQGNQINVDPDTGDVDLANVTKRYRKGTTFTLGVGYDF